MTSSVAQPSPSGDSLKRKGASFSNATLAALIVAGLAFGYLVFILPYAAGYGDYRKPVIQWLLTSWQDPTWQHGILTPFIAGFLIWRKRKSLAKIPLKPSYLGLLGIACCLFGYWVGYRGNFYFIGYASLQFLMAGIVLWLCGWRFFWAVSFAWLILGFAWPYLFLEDTLAFKLRYLMVTTTSWLLNHVGLDTIQDGTRLISAATTERAQGQWFDLNVDGPCSGLRSLFALMMVSTLFSYFRQRSWWRRLLLFTLSFPLAIVANMARILILIFASIFFGQEFAVGRGDEYTSNFHLLTGIFVYIVALGGLILGEKMLHKIFGFEKPLPLSRE